MTSKALQWARELGLNCELDIMAAQLRASCVSNLWKTLQTFLLVLILVALVVK